jgi:hypothetical protein
MTKVHGRRAVKMRRALSLILSVAMIAAFAVPMAVASAPTVSITLRLPAPVTPITYSPGVTFAVDVVLAATANSNLAAINNLEIKFDSNVLEWDPNPVKGEEPLKVPFAPGAGSGAPDTATLSAGSLIYNPPANYGENSAVFNFDGRPLTAAVTAENGVLLTLYLRVKAGAALGDNLPVFAGTTLGGMYAVPTSGTPITDPDSLKIVPTIVLPTLTVERLVATNSVLPKPAGVSAAPGTRIRDIAFLPCAFGFGEWRWDVDAFATVEEGHADNDLGGVFRDAFFHPTAAALLSVNWAGVDQWWDGQFAEGKIGPVPVFITVTMGAEVTFISRYRSTLINYDPTGISLNGVVAGAGTHISSPAVTQGSVVTVRAGHIRGMLLAGYTVRNAVTGAVVPPADVKLTFDPDNFVMNQTSGESTTATFEMPAFAVSITANWKPNFGDVDGDGDIEAGDLALMLEFIAADAAGKATFLDGHPRFVVANADVDGDYDIEAGDLAVLLEYIAASAADRATIVRGRFWTQDEQWSQAITLSALLGS